jgi:NADH-quinone oxidoreductase subunit N
MPAYFLEIAVVVLGLALLLAEAFTGPKHKGRIAYGALAGLTLIFISLFFVEGHGDADCPIWQFYTDDRLALFYKGLSLVCTAIVLILSLSYTSILEKFSARAGGGPAIGEFFCLPVFICAGMMWMASATDISTIFLSLELTTIGFYVMVAFMRRNVGSLEAGVKYLILGALSTGFLVYGLAWLFGVTGKTNLTEIGAVLASADLERTPALFAFALILVALSFKMAAVPFHFWVPDVYQGAPTPVTAFLSVGSKAAGLVVAGRVIAPFLSSPLLGGTCAALLLAVASATLLLGNLAAIPQTNFKRLLAYSSISHAGFLILALTGHGGGSDLTPGQIVAFYMGAYLCMTLLCFAVLVVINRVSGSDDLKAFDGLHQRSPFLAFSLLIGVASLAGVPLTAGFMGKFFVFISAAGSAQWIPLGIAVAGAAAGFYYYLKVIRNMYWNSVSSGDSSPIVISPLLKGTIIALIVATILFGVYPQPLLGLLK